MAAPEVEELLEAVERILDPSTDPRIRQSAHQVYESFKANTSAVVCVETACRLCLSPEPNVPSSVRFIGMQLLHSCVQQRWEELPVEVVVHLKSKAFELLYEVTRIPDRHVKHAATVFTVELIKKTWPQSWPGLMEQLLDMCHTEELCIEPVMMVLERLSQDLLDGDSHLTQARKQQLRNALTSACKNGLLAFFSHTLLCHSQEDHLDNPVHVNLACHVLIATATYLSWCSMKPIFENPWLMERLCQLVGERNTTLRILAVECLIALAERKNGHPSEREYCLKLFQPAPLEIFLNAAKSSGPGMPQESYPFLKRLLVLLLSLGTNQIVPLWGTAEKPGIGEPDNFAMYLDLLMAFLVPGSLCLSSQTLAALPAFLEHELISRCPAMAQRLPQILQMVVKLLVKPQELFGGKTQLQLYLAADFLDEQEFSPFFASLRNNAAKVLRQLVTLIPHGVAEWTSSCVMLLVDNALAQGGAHQDPSSAFALECDALQTLCGCVMATLFSLPKEEWPPSSVLIHPLEALLKWKSQDWFIVKMHLTMIESFSPFVELAPKLLAPVFEKIFDYISLGNPQGVTSSEQNHDFHIMCIRGGACFITICNMHAKLIIDLGLLQPLFSMVLKVWHQTSSQTRQLLSEGLICVSLALPTAESKQTAVSQVLEPVFEVLECPQVQAGIANAKSLSSFCCLDETVPSQSLEGAHTSSCQQLVYAVNTLAGTVRRYSKLKQLVASNASDSTSSMQPALDPIWEPVQRGLPVILRLIRSLNEFFDPAAVHSLGGNFKKAFDLTLVDKACLLRIDTCDPDFQDLLRENSVSQTQQRRMGSLYSASFGAIGLCANAFGDTFYELPDIVNTLTGTVFHNLQHLPRHILKAFIRETLCRHVIACPPHQFSTFLNPYLSLLQSVWIDRFNFEWRQMTLRKGDLPSEQSGYGDLGTKELLNQAEVIDDCLARSLMKSMMSLYEKLFPVEQVKSTAPTQAPAASGGVDMEDGEGVDDEDALPQTNTTQIALHIVTTPMLCQPMLAILFSALYSPDASLSCRSAKVLFTVFHQLPSDWIQHASCCQQVLEPILQGLATHGQHDSNSSKFLQLLSYVYPLLLQHHAVVVEPLLCRLPGVTEESVVALRHTCGEVDRGGKTMRTCLRKILSGIIGKSESEKYQLVIPEVSLLPIASAGSKSLEDAERSRQTDHILTLPDLGLPSLFQDG